MAKIVLVNPKDEEPKKPERANENRGRPIGVREYQDDPLIFMKKQHKRIMREMNRDHALVVAEDTVNILHIMRDENGDIQHLSFRSEADCELIHRPRPYFSYSDNHRTGPKWTKESRTKRWLADPKRRVVRSIVNAPQPWGAEPLPSDTLNMWLGYGCSPAPLTCQRVGGNNYDAEWPVKCQLILEHILDVWCDRNLKLFKWVIAWFAQMLQQPDTLTGSMLVIQGGQGTGKGIIVQALAKILGKGYLTINSKRYLVGNFNGILQGRLLVFADELFVKDPEAKNALKNKVSEPSITVELKGREPFAIANTARVLMATNEEHAIDAEMDDRRACVLKCSNHRRVLRETPLDHESRGYFNALAREVNGEGPSHFFRYLLEVDWRAVDLRSPPTTKALVDQKLLSLNPLPRWWYERLCDGRILGRNDIDDVEPSWPLSLTKSRIANSFEKFADRQKLGEHKRPALPEIWRFCTDVNGPVRLTKTGDREGSGDRDYIYSCMPLATARQAFCAWLSVSPELVSWGDDSGETSSEPVNTRGDEDEAPF